MNQTKGNKANISTLATRYNCKVMVSKIGMSWVSEYSTGNPNATADGTTTARERSTLTANRPMR